MKLFKFLFSLLFLLILSINFSTAAGTRYICKGQPVNLVWTSSGATSCTGSSGGLGLSACSFVADLGGSLYIPNPQSSCTVNYSCNNAGGNTPDSATLSVDETRVWNGSACAPLTWTRYCTPVGDANPNQFWEYSNSNPVGYRNTAQACCSLSGAAGTCPPPVATGNISANPSTCIIPVGASSCASTITWSSTNNTNPSVRVDYNNASILSSVANGSVSVPWISHGGNIFELIQIRIKSCHTMVFQTSWRS